MIIKNRIQEFILAKDKTAIISKRDKISYSDLGDMIYAQENLLIQADVKSGSIVFFDADYSVKAIALLLALLSRDCIIALSTGRCDMQNTKLKKIVSAEFLLQVDKDENIHISHISLTIPHPLIEKLRQEKRSGIIIFTSGTTGESKACLHDANRLFSLAGKQKRSYSTLSFLLFDHIGGLNTLFNCLFNQGTLVLPVSRAPAHIAESIATYKVNALITTPSFLNMLILSDATSHYDFQSLVIINYGAEPMPQATLTQLKQRLPHVKFKQSYGMSELGVIPTKSKSSDSLSVKLGDAHCQVRIVDGMLQVKTAASMLGYLNSTAPVTEDGWFKTGDVVIEEGGFVRIIGRKSDMINVGGEKVYPAQIEEVLHAMPGVQDVVVSGEKNPLFGSIIKAVFVLASEESQEEFRIRVRKFCEGKLENFQIPQKIAISQDCLHNSRFKKQRHTEMEKISNNYVSKAS